MPVGDTMSEAEARTAVAELKLAMVRAALLEGGQDDTTVRRRALAILAIHDAVTGHG